MSKTKVLTGVVEKTADGGDICKSLPFWTELSQSEQKTVVESTERIRGALREVDRSRTVVVVELGKVRAVLLGEGRYVKYLHTLGQTYRSAYRWMNRAAELALPESVLEAAAERGMDVLHSSYFLPIKEVPPPRSLHAPGAVDEYLNKIKELRDTRMRTRSPRAVGADMAERMAWRAVIKQSRAVKGRKPQERVSWVARLFGRLLAELGLPAMKVEPEAVPDSFRPKAGYPKGRPRVKYGRSERRKVVS